LTTPSAVYIYSYNAKRGYCNIFNGHNKHSHASLLRKVFRMQFFYMGFVFKSCIYPDLKVWINT
jgi:hypothetical protein